MFFLPINQSRQDIGGKTFSCWTSQTPVISEDWAKFYSGGTGVGPHGNPSPDKADSFSAIRRNEAWPWSHDWEIGLRLSSSYLEHNTIIDLNYRLRKLNPQLMGTCLGCSLDAVGFFLKAFSIIQWDFHRDGSLQGYGQISKQIMYFLCFCELQKWERMPFINIMVFINENN